MSDAGISTLGGFIKIERNNADSSGWTDITLEMLNYGFGDVNERRHELRRSDAERDRQAPAAARQTDGPQLGGGCNYNTDATGAKDPTNWWPNVLFDAREGLLRDWDYPNPAQRLDSGHGRQRRADPKYLTLGGTMYYVNIDVLNLQRWFKHNTAPFNVAASTGNLVKIDGTGQSVYFSDRRNNRNTVSAETGEYGWEDFVNPAAANGVPNNAPETGEDVNENGTQELYGGIPELQRVYNSVPPCALPQTCGNYAGNGVTVLTAANAKPQTPTISAMVAQVNRAILFRRALMLSNGAGIGANAVVADRLTGLTVVSENPVYIRGNWNAEVPAGTGFGGVNAATSIIADAVTFLSPGELARRTCGWTDSNSFSNPYNAARRVANAGGGGKPAGMPGWRSSAARAVLPAADGRRRHRGRLRDRRRRAQFPAVSGRLLRPDGQLPGLAGDALLQPAGGRHLQVLHHGVRRADQRLQFRRQLPQSGAAPAEHADVPRHERHRLLAGTAAGPVTPASQFLRARSARGSWLLPSRRALFLRSANSFGKRRTPPACTPWLAHCYEPGACAATRWWKCSWP